MKLREIIKLIKADGWHEIKSNSGSHKQYEHETKKGKVTIPYQTIAEIFPKVH